MIPKISPCESLLSHLFGTIIDTLQRVLSQGRIRSDLHFKWLILLQRGDGNERKRLYIKRQIRSKDRPEAAILPKACFQSWPVAGIWELQFQEVAQHCLITAKCV